VKVAILLVLQRRGDACDFYYSCEQVCVEPRPSALDVTLPAFAAERRRLQLVRVARSYRPISPLSSKPAGRRCCYRSMGQTNGRMDTRPLHKPSDSALLAIVRVYKLYLLTY